MSDGERDYLIPPATLKSLEAGKRVTEIPFKTYFEELDGRRCLAVSMPLEYWTVIMSVLLNSPNRLGLQLGQGIAQAAYDHIMAALNNDSDDDGA